MAEYIVTVPLRTICEFRVEARSERHAKHKVEEWYEGLRDEGDDLSIVTDAGMENERTQPRQWRVASR